MVDFKAGEKYEKDGASVTVVRSCADGIVVVQWGGGREIGIHADQLRMILGATAEKEASVPASAPKPSKKKKASK